MAKKEQTATGTEAVESTQTQTPARGTHQIITAKTREEIFAKVEEVKASLTPGSAITAGTVGQQDDGLYAIRIDYI